MAAWCALALAVLLAPPAAAGREWQWQHPHPVGHHLLAVWGSGPDDVYAVGGGGAVVHWDGRGWTHLTVPTKKALRAVWGSGPNDVYAVGSGGTILHFDGRQWLGIDLVDRNLYDVWGTGRKDVYVVGDRTLLHFDGSSWSPVSDVVNKNYRLVWPAGRRAVWVRSDGAEYRRLKDGQWDEGDVWEHGGVARRSPEGVFTARKNRSAMVYVEGKAVTEFEYPPVPRHPGVKVVWGTGPDDVHVTSGFGLMLHWDGSEWHELEVDSRGIRAMWGSGSDDVFAVGDRGRILHFDGAGWQETSRAVVDPRARLYGVWGTAPDNVYAVGEGRRIVHYDGSRWSIVHGEEADRRQRSSDSLRQVRFGATPGLKDVWGSGPDDVYAVGATGAVLRFDGQSWSAVDVGTREDLHAVWGGSADDVWIGGAEGTVLHFDGHAWAPVDIGATGTVVAGVGTSGNGVHLMEIARRRWVVWNSGNAGWTEQQLPANTMCEQMLDRNDCPAGLSQVGANGVVTAVCMDSVARFDGSAWTRVETPKRLGPHLTLTSTCSSGPDDLYAVARIAGPDSETVVLHHDGSSWRAMEAGGGPQLEGVWCAPNGEVFAVGTGILHHDPRPATPARRGAGPTSESGIPVRSEGRMVVIGVAAAAALLAAGLLAVLVIRKRG